MSACPVRASVALGAILLPLQFILTPTPEPPPVSVSTGLPWTSLWLPDRRRSHQDSPQPSVPPILSPQTRLTTSEKQTRDP